MLESEWHYIFHCPLFTDLRTGYRFRRRAAEVVSECNSSPRPCDVLCRIMPLCIKESVLANQLGSFIRLFLRARERWLNYTVSGGLHIDPAVRSNAQLHSVTLAFADGVAVYLYRIFVFGAGGAVRPERRAAKVIFLSFLRLTAPRCASGVSNA